MTPAQHAQLREVALGHFTRALREAVPLVGQDEARVRAGLFPLWRDAVHQTLVDVGVCPCVHHVDGCLLKGSSQEQTSRFPAGHSLGFDSFLTTFHEGVATAHLAIATAASLTDTQ